MTDGYWLRKKQIDEENGITIIHNDTHEFFWEHCIQLLFRNDKNRINQLPKKVQDVFHRSPSDILLDEKGN